MLIKKCLNNSGGKAKQGSGCVYLSYHLRKLPLFLPSSSSCSSPLIRILCNGTP